MTKETFWEHIKSFENRDVFTVTENEKNTIKIVEDTGRMSDRVIIEKGNLILLVKIYGMLINY
jgi:hypothetical protein